MEALGLDAIRSQIGRAGVNIEKRESDVGFHYELVASPAVRLVGERPTQGERVFDVVSHLMRSTDFGNTDFWLLWLFDRVYTSDEFSLGLLQALHPGYGEGPGGTWDGYRIGADEARLGELIASVVVHAEWDLFIVPSHGEYVVTFEHDRLIYYDRIRNPNPRLSESERWLVARHGFEVLVGGREGV